MAESCASIIAQAAANGQFLYLPSTKTYFAPAALERLQAKGRFNWTPENFRLIDPKGPEVVSSTGGYPE